MTLTKTIGASVVGIAFVAAPLLALAHDDEIKTSKVRVLDETAVSISIADNGSVLVRGARVTDIDNDRLIAATTVGDLTLTWRIDTTADTDFVDADGDANDIDDANDGNYVSFSGTLDTDADMFTVNADTVRNWSVGDDDDNENNNRPFIKFWGDFKTKLPGFSFWGHADKDKDNR